MKFRVQFKDPDALYDAEGAIKKAAAESLTDADAPGLTRDERLQVAASRAGAAMEFARTFLKYGEYLVIEFDLVAGTAVAVPEGQ